MDALWGMLVGLSTGTVVADCAGDVDVLPAWWKGSETTKYDPLAVERKRMTRHRRCVTGASCCVAETQQFEQAVPHGMHARHLFGQCFKACHIACTCRLLVLCHKACTDLKVG